VGGKSKREDKCRGNLAWGEEVWSGRGCVGPLHTVNDNLVISQQLSSDGNKMVGGCGATR